MYLRIALASNWTADIYDYLLCTIFALWILHYARIFSTNYDPHFSLELLSMKKTAEISRPNYPMEMANATVRKFLSIDTFDTIFGGPIFHLFWWVDYIDVAKKH